MTTRIINNKSRARRLSLWHLCKNMPYVSYWNNEMYEIIGPQKEYCIYNHGVGEPDHFWR